MFLRRAALAAFALVAGALPGFAQSNDPSFNLVNRSGRVIYAAFASPSSQPNWGQDHLGRNVLQSGQSFAIRLPAGECTTDIRVVYDRQGGPSEERRNVNTCVEREQVFTGQRAGGPAAPQGQSQGQPQGQAQPQQQPPAAQQPGQPGNPSFNLVNNSGRAVRELYASLATDQNWGPDRLGADVVPAGQSFPVRLPAGECVYDVRIVYDNGQAEERRRINLCEITNLTAPLR